MLRNEEEKKPARGHLPLCFTAIYPYLTLSELISVTSISREFNTEVKRKKIWEKYLIFLMQSSVIYNVERAVIKKMSGEKDSISTLTRHLEDQVAWSAAHFARANKTKRCMLTVGGLTSSGVGGGVTAAFASQGYLSYLYLTLTTSVSGLICGALCCFYADKIVCLKEISADIKCFKEQLAADKKNLSNCEILDKVPIPLLRSTLNFIEEKRQKEEQTKMAEQQTSEQTRYSRVSSNLYQYKI